MQKLILCLVFICILNSAASYGFELNCPWKLETEKESVSLEQFKLFLTSIIQSYKLCLSYLLCIGFAVTRFDLTTFQIKFTFTITIVKFLITQVSFALQRYQGVGQTFLYVESVFEFTVLLFMVGFCISNAVTINKALSIARQNIILRNLVQMLEYRKNLLYTLYVFVLAHQIIEVTLSASSASEYGIKSELIQKKQENAKNLSLFNEVSIICLIAIFQSGLMNVFLAKSCRRVVTSAQILEMNIL